MFECLAPLSGTLWEGLGDVVLWDICTLSEDVLLRLV